MKGPLSGPLFTPSSVLELKLAHFRNLTQAKFEVPQGARVVALVGPNGVGKTSVLEALSMLSPTRGFLGADAKLQVQHKAKEAGIWARLGNGQEVGQVLKKGARIVQVDGQKAPLETLAQILPQVWLTPATDFLFGGPPETRRRWLDDMTTALIPTHGAAVARFRQHRQNRLRLLTQEHGGAMQADWLDAEEKMAAEWGLTVLTNRLKYLADITPHMEGLTLTLQGSALEVMEAESPVMALKGKFERSREIDARMGRTHAGPNTVELAGELILEHGHKVPMNQASSGQHKRGLMMAMVGHATLLATARRQPPLVLIDEFSAHLDATRRAMLMETLLKLGSQVWLTDMEAPALLEGLYILPVGVTD
jgi:DNA replication and repair protein RecF